MTKISDIPVDQIISYLEANGYSVNQNNSLIDSPMELIQTYEMNNDTGGMPPNSIATLKTEREYGDWGKSCISVTYNSVQEAFLKYPSNYSTWSIVRSYSYETIDQLRDLLDTLTKHQKAGCWK
tara:strand:+ start:77 stop:448 length:372 start_codon:yes stop_codon:yes gene_type:complete